ncbi:MAG: ATP-binding protein [Lachnospiraceae bacterium]|nr:ATP-binding protein [Lachnospiraceae bacterium]
MKLLKVKANNFKNCADGFTIDLVAKSRKTAEDKEYELQEIAPDLHVYNTMAFIGKNASGKTSAIELLDMAYSILGGFRIEDKHYSYDGVELEIIFYHEGYIFLYETVLGSDKLENRAVFTKEGVYRKKYYKTNVRDIYNRDDFEKMPVPLFSSSRKELDTSLEDGHSLLPEDTSRLFYTLGKRTTRAVYFDSYEVGTDTYRLTFNALKNYGIDSSILGRVLRIFDENVESLEMLDEKNYKLTFRGEIKTISDTQLIHLLSSGTTKGLLLYILMVASLKEGFDLLIDEVENHFHKTLVENMISLYKDKSVNKHNATLVFTTHYCEVLDQMGRQDNIWICKSGKQVTLSNMYEDYQIRPELLKSKQYYNNAFQTAVDYEALMGLKKELKK